MRIRGIAGGAKRGSGESPLPASARNLLKAKGTFIRVESSESSLDLRVWVFAEQSALAQSEWIAAGLEDMCLPHLNQGRGSRGF